MSDPTQDDEAREDEVLLGRRCVTVHHGTLFVDPRIAKILGLEENQTLPETRTKDVEEEAQTDGERRQVVVLTPIIHVRPSRKGLLLGAAMLAVFALFLALQAKRVWSRDDARGTPVAIAVDRPVSVDPAPRPLPRTQVRSDERGIPVDIRGPDAAAVLAGFCSASDPTGRRKPAGISAAPARSGAVLGHFEDVSAPDSRGAILIYLDPRISRWRAGNGNEPIETIRVTREDAPELR